MRFYFPLRLWLFSTEKKAVMRSRLAQSLQAANGFTLARLLFAAMRLSASPAFAVKGPDDLRPNEVCSAFQPIADSHGVVALVRKGANGRHSTLGLIMKEAAN
jgi:hypothetical protein